MRTPDRPGWRGVLGGLQVLHELRLARALQTGRDGEGGSELRLGQQSLPVGPGKLGRGVHQPGIDQRCSRGARAAYLLIHQPVSAKQIATTRNHTHQQRCGLLGEPLENRDEPGFFGRQQVLVAAPQPSQGVTEILQVVVLVRRR